MLRRLQGLSVGALSPTLIACLACGAAPVDPGPHEPVAKTAKTGPAEAKDAATQAVKPTKTTNANEGEKPPEMKVQLIQAPSDDPSKVALALTFEIEDGWHIYWTNPGDSGLPTKLTFPDQAGFEFGPVEYPLPDRFVAPGEIEGFGYGHRTALFSWVSGAKLGDRVKAKASWLVCKSACVKQDAELELSISNKSDASFEAFRARIPHSLDEDGAPGLVASWRKDETGTSLTVNFAGEVPHVFIPEATDPFILERNEIVDSRLQLHWRRAAESQPEGPQGVIVFGAPHQPRPFTLAIAWPQAS